MSTITLPNIRVGSDLQVRVRLKDGGVAIDWSTLQNIKACIYSDAQRALAGRCAFSIDEEDSTLLVCTYAANKPQYLGVNRIVISAKYMGETKTYDKPAFSFVRWTADQEGEEITIDDPDVDVEIDVEDISSSILQEAVDAAFTAADRANEAAAAAEHMVDIHTGPEGKSAYEVAVEEGYTGTEEEWLASLKGDTGETPDISIGTVTTVAPGTPAAASMTGTPEEPVLNLSIPQGVVGATPNFTVGTVTTGEPGSSVIVTITGTPEAPVLNLTIPQGMQGNTGSSVEFPYELVNNLTTNDATKGLSAAQGVVLDGKVSQLEADVFGINETTYENEDEIAHYADGGNHYNNFAVAVWTQKDSHAKRFNRILLPPVWIIGEYTMYVFFCDDLPDSSAFASGYHFQQEDIIATFTRSTSAYRKYEDIELAFDEIVVAPAEKQVAVVVVPSTTSQTVGFLGNTGNAGIGTWQDASGRKSNLVCFCTAANYGESIYNATFNFGSPNWVYCGPILKVVLPNRIDELEGEANTLKSRATNLETATQNLETKTLKLKDIQIPLHRSLLMIEKSSVLHDSLQRGCLFTPEIISNFLMDMKLEGTPESGKIYDLGFQFQRAGSVAYANYLYLFKRNSDGSGRATVGTFSIGQNAPTELKRYELTINDEYITGCTVLLDYRALKDLNDDGTGYVSMDLYSTMGFRFNQSYLFDTATPSMLYPNIPITDIKKPQITLPVSQRDYPTFESGIQEIYISPSILKLTDSNKATVTVYQGKFRTVILNGNSGRFWCDLTVSELTNNKVYLLTVAYVYEWTTGVNVGDTVGFVIFNNVGSLSPTNGPTVYLNMDLVTSISAFSGRTDAFVVPALHRNKDLVKDLISGFLKNNATPYTQFGLPMIKKGTELPDIIGAYASISPNEFSMFCLDMKLVGTPEENTQYRFDYFQHRGDTGGPEYANYIRIVKSSDNWATQTPVVQHWVGSTPPSGMVLYEFTPDNSSLTKIRLLLNWDVLVNKDTGLQYYAQYNIPVAYKMEMAYMLNQEYGIIPLIDAYRGVANIQSVVETVVPDIVAESLNNGLEIQLPDVLYAVVGTEMNLWNDAIAYSMDKGLQSPMNYSIGWESSVGTVTDRCYRFTPESTHAGNTYSLKCYIYNVAGQQVATKTVQIKVKAKDALAQAKRIVYFGDSLGQSAASKLYGDFLNANKFTGTAPTMLGTKGTTYHYEAVGGYRWQDYATAGRRAFRCYVENFTDAIGLNTQYTNNGFTWKVIEVNVTNGSGNILITKEDISGTAAPQTNGTLVSTGSYASIPYTGAELQGANPLWNPDSEQLDIARYRSILGLGENEKIDAVSFQFGINDSALANNLQQLESYINALYDAFIADNPDCLFLIGLTTTAGNDANGSGANYGASLPNIPYNERVFKIRKFYLTLQGNTTRPNIRIAPIHPQVDRYYGYSFGSRQISQRYTETEQYHTNYVHPGDSGYGQIGDAYFAAYIGALTES